MKTPYRTDIRLGERYRDDQTGIEGTATAITFYQFGRNRGGVFLHPGDRGVPTNPGWCWRCLRHRVEQDGQRCPACREEGER